LGQARRLVSCGVRGVQFVEQIAQSQWC